MLRLTRCEKCVDRRRAGITTNYVGDGGKEDSLTVTAGSKPKKQRMFTNSIQLSNIQVHFEYSI